MIITRQNRDIYIMKHHIVESISSSMKVQQNSDIAHSI
jgi:hypothetical protein